MKETSITEWIQVGFVFIAGCYALYLLRQRNRIKRKEFVLKIYDALHNDKEIEEVIYKVDSNETSEIKYKGTLERQADKTLRYFDFIGQLIKDKHLKPHDIEGFKYEIKRVLFNKDVRDYILWLKSINVNLDNLKFMEDFN